MDPSSAIHELMSLLEGEREAIRRLDVDGVKRAAEGKESLAVRISSAPPAALQPLEKELGELRAALRHNGVLLAHARTCLKEATEISSNRRRIDERL